MAQLFLDTNKNLFDKTHLSLDTIKHLVTSKKLTYFERICPVEACSPTGMKGGHVKRGLVEMPELPGLHDSQASLSGQTKYTFS